MSSLILFALFVAISQNALGSLCLPLEVPETMGNEIATEFNSDERRAKANKMRSYMNESVDPCTDFYAFSCANWAKKPLLYDISMFDVINYRFALKVIRMLQSPEDPADNEIDKKVKAFYQSCINFSHKFNKDDYRQKLIEIMDEFGGMPAVKGADWNEDSFDWLETVAKIMHKYKKDIIIALNLGPDYMMSTTLSLTVQPPDLVLENRPMYVDEESAEYRQKYKKKIESNLFNHLDLAEEFAKQVAEEIVEFEVLLAAGLKDDRLGIDLNYLMEVTTASEMTQKYGPTLNIVKLINITIPELVDEEIYEGYESYQRNLVEVLKVTPKPILANYIMYNLLENFITQVSDNQSIVDLLCFEATNKFFTMNVNNMVYRRYNTEASERDLNSLWQEIKQSFSELMQSNRLEWISPETRQKAIEKLDAMEMEINNYQKENFTEGFENLQINNDDYIENIRNILQMGDLSELLEDTKSDLADQSLMIAPFYIGNQNMVMIPVVYLEPELFLKATYPAALKFGAIGTQFGHELTHGFDDEGRKYDQNGSFLDWWDVHSANAFEQRKQCLVDQFSHYSYGGRPLPKSPAQGENIADEGGLRLAYAAYLRWLQRAEDLTLETLPTMNYTSKQLFFIAYAQMWCVNTDPSTLPEITTDVHPPNELRIIASLSNYPEFAKEFNCGKKTPMNRGSKRCEMF